MLIKAGVGISRLNREIRRALGRIDVIYKRYKKEIVVTSTFEGNHGAGSLHYGDDAFDFRRAGRLNDRVVSEIREVVGPDYDVVVKPDHNHIEYDPKR